MICIGFGETYVPKVLLIVKHYVMFTTLVVHVHVMPLEIFVLAEADRTPRALVRLENMNVAGARLALVIFVEKVGLIDPRAATTLMVVELGRVIRHRLGIFIQRCYWKIFGAR